jgi:hypothetical protein
MLSCEAGQPQLLIGHVAFKFPITRGELGQVSLHCAEEVLHFLEGFLGTCSLREIGRKRDCPGNGGGRFRPPGRKDVPQRPHGSFCTPGGVNRRHDLLASRVIRIVHFKTDIRRRPEILTRGMNRGRAAKAANIIAHCFRCECSRRFVQLLSRSALESAFISLRTPPTKMFSDGDSVLTFCRYFQHGISEQPTPCDITTTQVPSSGMIRLLHETLHDKD